MTRKDDPVFNVRFVQLVEAHACLWNSTLPAYSKKEEIQKAWQSVANETNDTVRNSRERWRTIRSSFLRSLKLARTTTGRGKRKYYLSKYLQFLVPYTKTRLRNGVTIATLHKMRPTTTTAATTTAAAATGSTIASITTTSSSTIAIATTTTTTPPPPPLMATTIAASTSSSPPPLSATPIGRMQHLAFPLACGEDTKDSCFESRIYVGDEELEVEGEEDGDGDEEYEEDDEEEEALAEDEYGEERGMGEVEAVEEAEAEEETEAEAEEMHLQRLAAIKREPGCDNHYNKINNNNNNNNNHNYNHNNSNNNNSIVNQHLGTITTTTTMPRTILHNENNNYKNNQHYNNNNNNYSNQHYNNHSNHNYNNHLNRHQHNNNRNNNNNNSNNNPNQSLSTSLFTTHQNQNPNPHHHHHHNLLHHHQHQRNSNNNGNINSGNNSSSVDLTEFAEWIKSKNAHQRNCLMPPPDADQSFLNSLHPFLREMTGKQNRRFRQKVVALIDAVLENID